MPKYRVQSPDGKTWEVNAPDGASQDQVLEYAKSQWQQSAGNEVEPSVGMQAPQIDQPAQGMRGGRVDALLTGARDPIDAAAQLLPRGLEYATSLGGNSPNRVSEFFGNEARRVDQMVQGNEADYQEARQGQGREGFDALRLAGNVVSPANLAVGSAAAQATMGMRALPRLAASVPVGGVYGALQPVLEPGQDFAEQKLSQAAMGAALGPLADVGARAVSRIVQPQTGQAQRAMLSEGVELTPGQVLGGIGKRAEEKLVSWPFFGDAIRSAQGRSIESFNRAVGNRALGPIGKQIPKDMKPGREMVAHIRKTLGDEYDALLPTLQFKPDQKFAHDVRQVVGMTRSQAFPEKQSRQFEGIIRDKLLSKMTPQGNMNGPSFKQAEEGLKKEAQSYLQSPDPDQRKLGEAIGEVLASLRSGLSRSNPQQAERLSKINQGYAAYARIRRAASSTGAQDGVFTPAQLQSAVKASDKSVGKGSFARGDAFMQDFSDSAKSAIQSNVPNSGTADRLMAAGALGGATMIEPTILAGTLAGSGLYTRPGQNMLRALLASRPSGANSLSKAIAQFGPTGALPGVLPLVEVGQQ